jgi:hypothetical protein
LPEGWARRPPAPPKQAPGEPWCSARASSSRPSPPGGQAGPHDGVASALLHEARCVSALGQEAREVRCTGGAVSGHRSGGPKAREVQASETEEQESRSTIVAVGSPGTPTQHHESTSASIQATNPPRQPRWPPPSMTVRLHSLRASAPRRSCRTWLGWTRHLQDLYHTTTAGSTGTPTRRSARRNDMEEDEGALECGGACIMGQSNANQLAAAIPPDAALMPPGRPPCSMRI